MNFEKICTALKTDNWELGIAIAAPLLSSIIAIVAISVALYQLRVGRIETRSSQAHSIYQQYLAMCIQYPKFANGYVAKLDSESKRDPEYDRYKWFVSSLLFSFEQILEAKPKDKYWLTSIKEQLKIHKAHLSKAKTLKTGEWHISLQKLLDEVIK